MSRETLLTVAASVEAVATVSAVVAAVWAGYYAKRAFEKEVARDAERDEDRRRAQADRVAVWCEERYDYLRPATDTRTGKVVPSWPYSIRNASDTPIYAVEVMFQLAGSEPIGGEHVAIVPPGDKPMVREIPGEVRERAAQLRADLGEYITASILFRDAAGRTFSRDFEGLLVRYDLAGDRLPLPPTT